MPVTEFALLTLRHSYDPVELLERIMESQDIQDDWVRAHHPNDCAKTASVSRMLIDEARVPHRILITAPWQSPAAHHEWIATPENQAVMAKLSSFLEPPINHSDNNNNNSTCDSENGTSFVGNPLLFHLESAGRRPHLHKAFPPRQELAVLRLLLTDQSAAGRSRLQARYTDLEDALVAETPVDKIWAGWRIENDGQDELVVFYSRHMQPEQLAPLKQHAKQIDTELHVSELVRSPKPNP